MINSVILMGRMCGDIELRTSTSGTTYGRFSLAVDRSYARQGEEKQTDFINVLTFGKTAEFVSRYFSKGSMIAVQGSIQTGRYVDSQGNNRTSFEVVAREVSFCGSKSDGSISQAASQTAASVASAEAFDTTEMAEEDLPF